MFLCSFPLCLSIKCYYHLFLLLQMVSNKMPGYKECVLLMFSEHNPERKGNKCDRALWSSSEIDFVFNISLIPAGDSF